MTPEGVVAVFDKSGIKQYKNGMITKYEKSGNAVNHGSNGFVSGDLEVTKIVGNNNWTIKIGSGIEITIERRHVSILTLITTQPSVCSRIFYHFDKTDNLFSI